MKRHPFVTAKWNYAPKARQISLKAIATLEHAVSHLEQTHDARDVWYDDPAIRDAFAILKRASAAVVAWEIACHAAAKLDAAHAS